MSQNNEAVVDRYPQNVGILAYELYFPAQYVDQEKLEQFDGVSAGKYTIGLGQHKMSFCLDNEDINSICLTSLSNLMRRNSIRPEEIGRLDVGTETPIDKAKSVKTCLMKLFEDSGNTDVEGADNLSACFGGTAALFNAVNWVESSYWDGRYAVVVMGDIAVYSKGSARPTGGAGSISLLIGPDAPLVFERGLRAAHVSHSYDFYKPKMDSEYPIVDGKLSIGCYMNALDRCYGLYKKKYAQLAKTRNDLNNNKKNGQTTPNSLNDEFNMHSSQGFVFHSPYCKLVQKSFARLLWNDFKDSNETANSELAAVLGKYKNLSNEETFNDRNLEKDLITLSDKAFKEKTSPSLMFARQIGNMYTPSLYGCLASHLLSLPKEKLINERVTLFSYGSGLASVMFSLKIIDHNNSTRFRLDSILESLRQAQNRVTSQRLNIEPQLYDHYLKQREVTHKQVPFVPITTDSQVNLYPGTWYLTGIDDMYRRTYAQKSHEIDYDLQAAQEYVNKKLLNLQAAAAATSS